MSLSRSLWRVTPRAWVWLAVALAGLLPLVVLTLDAIDPGFREHLSIYPLWFIVVSELLLFLPLTLQLFHLFRRQRRLVGHAKALSVLMDQAADMMLVCRRDGRIVEGNARALEFLGLKRSELLATTLWDLDLDCVLRARPELRQALEAGEAVSFETRFRTLHGERAVEPHVRQAEWDGDIHYVLLVRDITARKHNEAKLRAFTAELERARNLMEARVDERTRELSESFAALTRQTRDRLKAEQDLTRVRLLLNNIFESMPSILVALDLNGTITQWNREAASLTGISREDAVGRRVHSLFPHFAPVMGRIREALREGRHQHRERVSGRLNDEVKVFDLVVFPLIADHGRGVVIRADDVTERVRMEEMLVQTEKILSLGGLAAGMAHEINNPLGGILQSAQNILRRLDFSRERNQALAQSCGVDTAALGQYLTSQRIPHFLEGIQEAGCRAAAIVADTLSFARGASSDSLLIDPAEALDSAVRLAGNFNPRARLDFRHIDIVREYSPSGRVRAQKTKLEQVFLNLLVNAAHALAVHAGEAQAAVPPRIILRVARDEDWVRIDVIDNGPGMDEQVRRRIFEPFYTTKEEGAGTGLGLSVSFFIVTEQLKGSITVESSPGHGAHFIIRLPRVAESEPDAPPHDEQIELPLES